MINIFITCLYKVLRSRF